MAGKSETGAGAGADEDGSVAYFVIFRENLKTKNKGGRKMRKMRKFFEKIRQNQDYQGIALAVAGLLGWPVLWLGVLAVCVLFAVVSGWIVSVL